MLLEFTVLGKPATKGSTKSFIRSGRIVTVADNKNLSAWSHAAKVSAWAARQKAGMKMVLKPEGVRLNVLFQFLPPKADPARRRHTVKPDLDKLLRAILDSLTGVIFQDDSQVTSALAAKHYGTHEECVVQVFDADDPTGL